MRRMAWTEDGMAESGPEAQGQGLMHPQMFSLPPPAPPPRPPLTPPLPRSCVLGVTQSHGDIPRPRTSGTSSRVEKAFWQSLGTDSQGDGREGLGLWEELWDRQGGRPLHCPALLSIPAPSCRLGAGWGQGWTPDAKMGDACPHGSKQMRCRLVRWLGGRGVKFELIFKRSWGRHT